MTQSGKPAEILVVEDEVDLREMIAEELDESGYRTRQAGDGAEALTEIRRSPPDLVLCDINMPGLDGYGLLESLRETEGDLAELPFIFLTAFADRGEVKRGLDCGADDYITKPIDFDVLIARVGSRLREAQRFLDKREEAMVKLYKAMNRSGEPGVAEAGGAAAPARPPKVDSVTYDRDAVIAARLFIINLSMLRRTLGDRWREWSERVETAAHKIIGAHIGEGDRVGRNKAGDFVICFASLDGERASEVSEAIQLEIERKFLGEEAVASWGAETHQVTLGAGDRQDDGSLIDAVSERIGQLNQSIEAQHDRLIREIDHSGQALLIRLETAGGQPAPLTLARFDEDSRARIRTLVGAGENRADLLLELDLLMLDKVCHILAQTEFSRRTIVATDLHHATVMEKGYREAYLTVLRQLPERCRNSLALNLVGGPFRTCPSEADRKALIAHSKIRLLRFEGQEPGAIELPLWRAALLSVSHQQLTASGALNSALLATLVERAHTQGGRILLRDVPATAAPGLIEQGVDFLAPADGP